MRAFSADNVEGNVAGANGGGPCLYCQVDEEEGAENDDGNGVTREVLIVPTDPTSRESFPSCSHQRYASVMLES